MCLECFVYKEVCATCIAWCIREENIRAPGTKGTGN